MNIFSLCGFLVGAASVGSVALVLLHDRRSVLNISWAIFSVLVGLWGIGFGLTGISLNYGAALQLARFHNLIAIAIPAAFYWFTMIFCGNNRPLPIRFWAGIIATILYASVCLGFSHQFVSNVSIMPFSNGYYAVAGPLYGIFPILYGTLIGLGLTELFISRSTFEGYKRIQFLLLFWGFVFGFSGGGTTFLGVFGLNIPPLGVPGVVFYELMIAYAITKHNLMDIKVVITRAAATGGAWVSYLIPFIGIIVLRNWLPGPTALYYGIWGTIGAFGFIPFRNWLQTSAYKKFLQFDYNFEETLKSASSLLVFAQDKESVLESVYTLQRNMEIGESYAILRTDDNSYECYVQQYTDEELTIQQTWKARFEATSSLIIEFGDVNRRVVKFGELSEGTKAQLKSHGVHPRSLLIAIHSFQELQAIFVVGQKLSEEDYTEQDEALFEVYLNQAVTVFERITQNRKLRDQSLRLEVLNSQLEGANQELRVLNTQLHEINLELEEKVREAVALAQKHFHQAAFSTLATGMAHEIRNPIAAMVAGAGFMAESMEGRKENPGEQFGAWNRPIGAKDLLDVTQNDADKAEQLYSKLQENGVLNPRPMILDFKRKIPASIDLGPGYEQVQGPVRLWFKLLGTMGKFFDLVNVVTQQGPRILDITDNMMKYGVSGGGVKSDSFAKLPGITDDMSADIFEKLVRLGYLDLRGGVMPKLGQLESAGPDLLGEELGPDYLRFVPGVIDIIRTTPGAVKRPVKIDDILNDTISLVEGNCRKQNIILVRQIQSDLPDVAGDEFRLQQGFFNIIYNAIQAMELVDDRPRQLSIWAQTAQFPVVGGSLVDGIKIQIEDTGPGMDAETKGKIFNPFFSTKGPTGGKNIGLGLSILYEVVSGHNGYVDVDSEPGVGTRFTVYLPRL